MAPHNPSLRTRLLRLVGGAVAVAAAGSFLAAGPAVAAPKVGHAKGHLVLAVDGADVATLPPGQAIKRAQAVCATRDNDVAVTVADVRAAFPEPVVVCDGVTLRSQVAAEADDADADDVPA